MLIATRHAYGAVLEGPDGRVGTLYDVLFDDQSWKVRHLLVSRDRWFHGHQVLVEPDVVERTDWAARRLSVRLTKEQIPRSPSAETDLPIARRKMREAAKVLAWEAYWTGVLDTSDEEEGNQHLRSTKMLTGLHIYCTDGMFGHVDDFVIDDETWAVRYLVVATRNWRPGKHVLVEPAAIASICWEDGQVHLSRTREEVYNQPAYEGVAPSEHAMVDNP